MNASSPRTAKTLSRTVIALALAAGSAIVIAQPAQAAPTPTYDSIPAVLAGNYQSQGFEAGSVAEFGDLVELDAAATERVVKNIEVVFSSWACETGGGASCVTTPDATFSHPITLNVYDPAHLTTPIASVTQTVEVPYRPSAEPLCPGGTAWSRDGGVTCFNGFAFPVDFDFSAVTPEVVLPDQVVVTVEYNTANRGYTPTGVAGGADSLNVAVLAPAPTVGSVPNADDMYLHSTDPNTYGDGGTVGAFRASTGWNFSLLMEITTDLPTLADPGTTPAASGPQLAATGTPDYLPVAAAVASAVVALGIVALVIGYRKRRARHLAS